MAFSARQATYWMFSHLLRNGRPRSSPTNWRTLATTSEQPSTSASRIGGILWGVPVLTFCLGCWQTYRLNWKLDLIKKTEDSLKADAIPFRKDQSKQHQRVLLHGKFIRPSFLLGPRPRSSDTPTSGLFSTGGANRSGYYIVNPFLMNGDEDGGGSEKILVARGWLPKDVVESNWNDQMIGMEVTLEGMVRQGENGTYMPKNNPDVNQWYWLDASAMAKLASSSDTVVELISGSKLNDAQMGVVPKPRTPGVNIANNHLSYALTWYGLCAFSTWALLRGRRRPSGLVF
ncbi:hypothetical protein SmJEL517_g01819 [Synchytrium microbalum]|uniref:SURF1-like protein n=1 Tax=Synchytrium microbalum TaxID=1806994 RepID=A0A507C380_9FUNG|nr:uncharacterized protein SmJEL517_g01819 [Synchytrium microbalum]TPX35970.1 hypothetical protein SmJEL517_g01819 [Synchytrium microbalum]